jgi:hypothetical protein
MDLPHFAFPFLKSVAFWEWSTSRPPHTQMQIRVSRFEAFLDFPREALDWTGGTTPPRPDQAA